MFSNSPWDDDESVVDSPHIQVNFKPDKEIVAKLFIEEFTNKEIDGCMKLYQSK